MARRAGWRQWLSLAVVLTSPHVASAAIDPAPPSPDLLLFIADSEEAVEDASPESSGDDDDVDLDDTGPFDRTEPDTAERDER